MLWLFTQHNENFFEINADFITVPGRHHRAEAWLLCGLAIQKQKNGNNQDGKCTEHSYPKHLTSIIQNNQCDTKVKRV